jgi:hypothetical protein
MAHTLAELNAMSNEDLNNLIETLSNPYVHKTDSKLLLFVHPETGESSFVEARNYSTNITDAYLLEGSIPKKLRELYMENLMAAIRLSDVDNVFNIAHAPARVRSIAFIITREVK